MSDDKRIRPIALCVFRRGDRILVAEGYDEVKGEAFYRPPGGGLRFGEHSAEALRREMREEFDVEITDLRLLDVMENIFTCRGRPGHEIVFVYDADPVDPSFYEREPIEGEDTRGGRFRCRWLDPAEVSSETPPVYPDGLVELFA